MCKTIPPLEWIAFRDSCPMPGTKFVYKISSADTYYIGVWNDNCVQRWLEWRDKYWLPIPDYPNTEEDHFQRWYKCSGIRPDHYVNESDLRLAWRNGIIYEQDRKK